MREEERSESGQWGESGQRAGHRAAQSQREAASEPSARRALCVCVCHALILVKPAGAGTAAAIALEADIEAEVMGEG